MSVPIQLSNMFRSTRETNFHGRKLSALSLLISISLLSSSWVYAESSTINNASFSVAEQTITSEQQFEGVVEAVNQATITAQTAGQLTEVNFDVDDYVQKGQVIARIRSIEQRATTDQTKAQVAEAEAYYRVAQSEFNRVKSIFDKQAISASQMDKAHADLSAAQARLEAARANARRVSTQEQYTSIVAPYSGLVIQRHMQTGEIANIGSPIMTGLSLDELRVVANVPQTKIQELRQHKKARILVNMGNETKSIESTKVIISPIADVQSHTFKVRIELPPKIGGLYPGMFVKVAMKSGEEKALMIPVESVAYRGEVRAVYVQGADKKISMRQVRLGEQRGEAIQILAGLNAGEIVMRDPVAAVDIYKLQQMPSKTATGGH